ncbi:PilT protein domain protein [Oscillochloris trichoides DG-6]|uniref:PilT protein domain protein n=1 Tax=Oscillochloris trichoides DG-6 TaxID=765420 RepID=E1IDE7_9CHLR|nr:PIN domain-containing protein [Oscillochloris trichoides]EFO80824.1 PilT protein domain protein [Oscillochloris trichoides DG-6]
MKVSLNFLVRIAGMLVLAYIGWAIGGSLSSARPDDLQLMATQLLMLSGAGLGLLVTPRLTLEPIQDLINHSRHIPLSELFLVGFGSMIGLFFAVLITVPLSTLPAPFSTYLPIMAAGVGAYVGATIFATRKRDIVESMRNWRRSSPALTLGNSEQPVATHRYILDTSTIIDGRIAAVVQTGFLNGSLIVPGFVLAELQQLADSNDELRRSKGRRGLELLNSMQKQSPLPIEVINVEVAGTNKVDDKLVAMARQYNCPVITNDFNLNRVASLQGVKVLSLNQLSEAVRPPVVQDQRLQVLIRNEGNARQQGVGYLDDGTPVIVEDARHLIGKTVEVSVIRLHQTQTGRLVFAQLIEGE